MTGVGFRRQGTHDWGWFLGGKVVCIAEIRDLKIEVVNLRERWVESSGRCKRAFVWNCVWYLDAI